MKPLQDLSQYQYGNRAQYALDQHDRRRATDPAAIRRQHGPDAA